MTGQKGFSLVWTEKNVKPDDAAFEGPPTATIYETFDNAIDHAHATKGQVANIPWIKNMTNGDLFKPLKIHEIHQQRRKNRL